MSTPRSSSPRSRRLFMTSLLALSMLTACQRGCSRKGGRNGASSRATDTGAVSQPPKAPPGVQPVLRYVQQRLEGGKFITPLAPPDPAPQASNEPALPDLPPIGKHRRIPAPAAPPATTPAARSRSTTRSSRSTAWTRTTCTSSTRRGRSSRTASCTAARWCSPAW